MKNCFVIVLTAEGVFSWCPHVSHQETRERNLDFVSEIPLETMKNNKKITQQDKGPGEMLEETIYLSRSNFLEE